jgi:anti-sigma regulatory factor (Ser/Thr protein kinase)
MDLKTPVGSRLQFVMPGGNLAPAMARGVIQTLADVLDARRLSDARLLVTEMVTNGMHHGGSGHQGTIVLRVAVYDTAVRIWVSNSGADLSHPSSVESVADDWGIDDVHETRVWFEMAR